MRLFWLGYLPFTALVFAYMAACGLDYGSPVLYTEQTVRTPVVRQGEVLRVFFAFRRLRDCELDRQRLVIDGDGGWHQVGHDRLAASGKTIATKDEELEVRIPIGDNFAPGPSAYRPILAYQCALRIGPFTIPNLFQEFSPIVLVLDDQPFTILPRSED